MNLVYNAFMPYNYTHALLGVASSRLFHSGAQCIFSAYPDAFFIGSMGPDPYYADGLLRPLLRPCRAELADMLHAVDGNRLFSALAGAAGGDGLRQAYALGFFCHFMLDYSTHPYIYAFYPDDAHTPGEIAIDPLMVERMGDARFLQPPKAFYQTAHISGLDAYHADFCELLFTKKTTGVFARSLRKWLLVNTATWDPQEKKYRLLRPVLPKLAQFLQTPVRGDPYDALNLARRPWPDGSGRRETFVELFDAAVPAAARGCDLLADAMLGRIPLREALIDLSGRNMNAA